MKKRGQRIDQESARLRYENFRHALRLKKLTLSAFSQGIGVTSSALHAVFIKQQRSQRIEKAVADFLEESVAVIWPERQ